MVVYGGMFVEMHLFVYAMEWYTEATRPAATYQNQITVYSVLKG